MRIEHEHDDRILRVGPLRRVPALRSHLIGVHGLNPEEIADSILNHGADYGPKRLHRSEHVDNPGARPAP